MIVVRSGEKRKATGIPVIISSEHIGARVIAYDDDDSASRGGFCWCVLDRDCLYVSMIYRNE